MRYYSIGVFASKIGVTIQTLINWDKNAASYNRRWDRILFLRAT